MNTDPVKVSTTLPSAWADALERLSHMPVGRNRAPSRAAMLRAGVRLYLQHRLPHEWDDLELGPEEPPARYPGPVIDVEAVEIPLDDPPELPAP